MRRRRILRASRLLALIGLIASAYLSYLHVDLHTGSGESARWCTLAENIDCDDVARSPYAVLLGVPVAVWGALGYTILLGFIGWGLRSPGSGRSWPVGLYWLLNAANLVVAIVMATIAKLMVGALCIGCLALYAVAVLLFIAATALLRQRPGALSADLRGIAANRPALALAAGAGAAAAALCLFYPRYWETSADAMPAQQIGSHGLPAGTLADGSCWIGAENPTLEIVEFSDYLCPYCRQSYRELSQKLMSHPTQIRLIHKHFPLDSECHPRMPRQLHAGACRLARMAYCAGRQGRFWDMNDYLFANRASGADVAERAARSLGLEDPAGFLECIDSRAAAQHVAADIREGMRLGVEGTPTLFVKGKRYLGKIPESELQLESDAPE